MVTNNDVQIVPGLSVNMAGQATVDSSIADVLFDLAIKLEEMTTFPVDVQHVVAALVLTGRNGELDSQTPLSPADPVLTKALAGQMKTVFGVYGGNVGMND